MNRSVELFEDHSSRLGLSQPSNLMVTMVRSHLSSKSSETHLKKTSPCPVSTARPFQAAARAPGKQGNLATAGLFVACDRCC